MQLSTISTTVWLHYFNEMPGEKARLEIYKGAACCFEQILGTALYKTAVVWPLISHLTNHSNKTSKTCWGLLVDYGFLHMETPVISNQKRLTLISCVWTLDAI